MKKLYKIESSLLIAFIIFLLIIAETIFENTPLQPYNLLLNKSIFLVEIVLFIFFLVQEKFLKKYFYIFVGLFVIFLLSFFVLNSFLLLKMFIFSTVVSKIGVEKSFEMLFKIKLLIIFFIILLSLIGILSKNHIAVEKGIGTVMGYGLGYTHPNRLASAITYTILCYVGWKKDKITFLNIFFIFCLTIVAFVITQSRTLIYCMSILIFCLVFLNGRNFKKIISFLGIILFPINAFVSVYIPMLLLTSSGTVQKIVFLINQLFSRRFTHIEHLFLSYSIPWFGGIYDFIRMKTMFSYSVIDNAYVRFMYQYGIIGLMIFGVMTIISVIILKQKKEFIWICIALVVMVEGILENIYTDIGQNILLLFWALMIKKLFYEERT